MTIDEALERARRADARSPEIILALSPGVAHRWRAALGANGGAFAYVATIEALVSAAEEHALLPEMRDVDAAERIAIASDVLRGEPDVRRSFEADPHALAALVLRLCDELALHGFHRIGADALDAIDGPAVVRNRIRLLHRVALTYRAELALRGADRISRLERAAAALSNAPHRTFPLIVDGIERLRPLELELVDSLERSGAEVIVAPAPAIECAEGTLLRDLLSSAPGTVSRVPDGSFVRVCCRDVLEEAEVAARLVLSRLEGGTPPERIAVQAPAGVGYGDLLARVFAEQGLTLSATDRIRASATPLYQAFRAFVRLFYRGPDPFDLAAVFGGSGSGVKGGRRDAITRELLKRMPDDWQGVRTAVKAATSAVDPVPAGKAPRAEDEVARHSEAREAALGIVDVLERGPSGRTVEDPLVAARSLREAILWFCGDIGNAHRLLGVLDLPDRDAEGHRDAAAALRNGATLLVERATNEGGTVAAAFRDAAAFLQAVEPLLPDLDDDVSKGAIQLRFGDEAAGAVDHLIMLGFSRGRWPSAAGTSKLLGTLEREALRKLGGGLATLPRPEDIAVRNAEDARSVLAQARQGAVVITPTRGESGNEASPALLLVDLLRRMDDSTRLAWRRANEVTFGTVQAGALFALLGPGLPQRATARHALRALAAEVGSTRPLSAVHRAAAAKLIATGCAQALAAPWRPDRTFEIPVPLDVAAREFSASQLEALLSCRYRYFTSYVLSLRSLEMVRQPSLSVATIGDIAHKVLEALDYRLMRAGDEDVRTALAAVLAQHYSWALNERYRAGVASVERELLQFVPAYQSALRGMVWVNGASEVEFGEKAGKPATFPLDGSKPEVLRRLGTDRLRMQGRVDRVDEVLVRKKPYRLVTDFKFGNVAKYLEQRDVAMGIQAAIYPSVLVQLGGPPPLGFAYFSVTNRNGNLLPSSMAPLPDELGDITVDDLDLETFQRNVSEVLTARLALLLGDTTDGGAGDITPHSVEERKRLEKARVDSCRYCEGWLLCRFEEEGA